MALLLVGSVLSIAAVGIPAIHAGGSSSIGIDGSASTGCGYVTSCSVSLTTTQSNDLIIVGCDCYPVSSSFSVRDGSGLTFVQRASQLSIGGNQFIQTWYAVSSSPLSSDSISIVTTNTGETWYGMVVFAVTGANTANPFLSGYPISQANLACSSPCNEGVTAPAGTFVFQVGGDTGNTLQTAGTGMTLIQASRSGQDIYAQYQVLSSALSSAKLSFGTPQGNDFGVVADAINPSPSSTSSPSSSSSSSSSSVSSSSSTSVTPPALDGSASKGCAYVTSCSSSLMTSQPNDVIIVGCDCFPYGTAFSVHDTAGLTFAPRESQLNIGGGQFIQTWYAISSSPLSSDVISVTTTDTGETWYGVVVFGVSGANTANPFTGGFPVSQANLNCASPCNTGISAPAGSFVFQVGGDTGNTLQSAGVGMALIASSRAGQDVYAQYTPLSSPISAATLSFGTPQGNDFGVVADAINPSLGSSSSTSSTSSSSTSRTSSSSSSSSSSSTSTSSTASTSTSSTSSSLAIDESTSVVSYGVSGITTSVTTAHPNDLIVLFISTGQYSASGCGSLPAPPVITSVIDAKGLTWHQRSTGTTTICEVSPGPADKGYGFQTHLEEWYTIASTPLSSDVISITAASVTSEIQDIEFGISGANTQSPFDSSNSLPCVATGYSTTPQCTLSTMSSSSMVIMGDAGPNGAGPDGGFSLILFSAESVQDMSSEYQVFTSPQSGITVGFTAAYDTDIANGNDTWVVIGDAIQAAPPVDAPSLVHSADQLRAHQPSASSHETEIVLLPTAISSLTRGSIAKISYLPTHRNGYVQT